MASSSKRMRGDELTEGKTATLELSPDHLSVLKQLSKDQLIQVIASTADEGKLLELLPKLASDARGALEEERLKALYGILSPGAIETRFRCACDKLKAMIRCDWHDGYEDQMYEFVGYLTGLFLPHVCAAHLAIQVNEYELARQSLIATNEGFEKLISIYETSRNDADDGDARELWEEHTNKYPPESYHLASFQDERDNKLGVILEQWLDELPPSAPSTSNKKELNDWKGMEFSFHVTLIRAIFEPGLSNADIASHLNEADIRSVTFLDETLCYLGIEMGDERMAAIEEVLKDIPKKEKKKKPEDLYPPPPSSEEDENPWDDWDDDDDDNSQEQEDEEGDIELP